MIEDLGNNRWNILGRIEYGPNLVTIIKRLIDRNDWSTREKIWLRNQLELIKG